MDAGQLDAGRARAANEGNVLVGTLRRAYDLDGSTGAVCVLVTEDGQAFHLNGDDGDAQPRDPLADLRKFESRLVRVAFERREDTVFGPSLFGVRVEAMG